MLKTRPGFRAIVVNMPIHVTPEGYVDLFLRGLFNSKYFHESFGRFKPLESFSYADCLNFIGIFPKDTFVLCFARTFASVKLGKNHLISL